MKKIIYPVLIFILLIFGLSPLLKSGFFSHHDDMQIIRLYEMDKCVRDGQIPCRWVPDLGGLYGYPLFNYYAPLPYYIGEFFHLLGFNFIDSVKIMFAAAFIFSSLFMYLLGSSFWGKKGGLISALFYAYAPYHAVDFYVRGAMGELWAIMFFPLIIWSIFCFIKTYQRKYLVFFILSVTGLILSHNLMAMLFLPVVAFFILLFVCLVKKINLLKIIFLSLILSLGLSAFFWLPAILEKQYAHTETMTMGYFGYTEHFKGLRKLFLENEWGWGASIREIPGGEKDGMSYQIGYLHLLLFFISILVSGLFLRRDKKISFIIILAFLIFIFSVFMINPKSVFIWNKIPVLAYIQFPWRFLAFIIFITSWMSGSIFLLIKAQKIQTITALFLIVALLILNKDYFQPEKYYSVEDKDYLSGPGWEQQIKRSIFDYLPVYAEKPPAVFAQNRYQIISGEAEIKNWQEGTNWINFSYHSQKGGKIRLSQYYFPGWTIFIDQNKTLIDYQNSLGLMIIDLPPGQHQFKAKLEDTSIRQTSNIISLSSLIILLIFLTKPKTLKLQ